MGDEFNLYCIGYALLVCVIICAYMKCFQQFVKTLLVSISTAIICVIVLGTAVTLIDDDNEYVPIDLQTEKEVVWPFIPTKTFEVSKWENSNLDRKFETKGPFKDDYDEDFLTKANSKKPTIDMRTAYFPKLGLGCGSALYFVLKIFLMTFGLFALTIISTMLIAKVNGVYKYVFKNEE